MIKILDIELMIKFRFSKFIILLFPRNIDTLSITHLMGIATMIINCGAKLASWIKTEARFLCMNHVRCVLLYKITWYNILLMYREADCAGECNTMFIRVFDRKVLL